MAVREVLPSTWRFNFQRKHFQSTCVYTAHDAVGGSVGSGYGLWGHRKTGGNRHVEHGVGSFIGRGEPYTCNRWALGVKEEEAHHSTCCHDFFAGKHDHGPWRMSWSWHGWDCSEQQWEQPILIPGPDLVDVVACSIYMVDVAQPISSFSANATSHANWTCSWAGGHIWYQHVGRAVDVDIRPYIGQACKGNLRQQFGKDQKVYRITELASKMFCTVSKCQSNWAWAHAGFSHGWQRVGRGR